MLPAHEVDGLLPRPVRPAAHYVMHRGQPALGRHQPVSILVETSGCFCRGSRLIYQQVSLSPPGGAPERSAPGQVCGSALLARLTCPHLDGRPSTAVGRVSSPRGVLQCLMPRNNIPHRIFYTYICHHPKPGYNVNVSCIATYTLSSIFFMYDNDGNTETDRTGAAQDYHLTICILILRNFRRPPPNPMMYMPARW